MSSTAATGLQTSGNTRRTIIEEAIYQYRYEKVKIVALAIFSVASLALLTLSLLGILFSTAPFSLIAICISGVCLALFVSYLVLRLIRNFLPLRKDLQGPAFSRLLASASGELTIPILSQLEVYGRECRKLSLISTSWDIGIPFWKYMHWLSGKYPNQICTHQSQKAERGFRQSSLELIGATSLKRRKSEKSKKILFTESETKEIDSISPKVISLPPSIQKSIIGLQTLKKIHNAYMSWITYRKALEEHTKKVEAYTRSVKKGATSKYPPPPPAVIPDPSATEISRLISQPSKEKLWEPQTLKKMIRYLPNIETIETSSVSIASIVQECIPQERDIVVSPSLNESFKSEWEKEFPGLIAYTLYESSKTNL